MNVLGSLRPDAPAPLELVLARLRQGFDRAEVAQQVAALGRTDAGDPVQLGGEKRPASEIAVIRNREAMGLVSDALQDMRGGGGRLQDDRGLSPRQQEPFFLLTLCPCQ